jgi:serine/threonine-protein phosphatase 6 regulatory ankyrin repeat subunit B
MIAAVMVPLMSMLVKHYGLGVFISEPPVLESPGEHGVFGGGPEATDTVGAEGIKQEADHVERNLTPPMSNAQIYSLPWRRILLHAWLAASLVLVSRLVLTFALGVRLLNRAKSLNRNKIEQAVHLAKTRLGISKEVKVYASEKIHSPVIWCWRRRSVLLVPSTAEKLSNSIDWPGVLSHELAHWKRRDHITGLLAELVVCILPWHPLLWWAKSRLIALSEQACDDWVVATGRSNADYAESLLGLTPEGQMAFVPAVVSTRNGLSSRVRRILKDHCGNPRIGAMWTLAVVIVAACLSLGVALAQTRPAEPVSAATQEESPAKSLHEVAKEGKVEEVKRLISEGADVNAAEGEDARTPLLFAAKEGHAEIVKLLLASGADVNAAGTYGYTALYYAIFSGDEETVKVLVSGGIDVNKGPADEEGDYSTLVYAIWEDNAGMVKAILDAGADINIRDEQGCIPLYWAAFTSRKEVFDLILAEKGHPDTVHMAAARGDLDRVKVLMEKGSDVNAKDEFACTPLHWAALADSPAVADFLLAKGAVVDAEERTGWTPLMNASALPVVELLLAKGADFHSQHGPWGWTKMHIACASGHTEIAKLLISKGVDVNARSSRGRNTALCYAARNNHVDIVELLIKKGADVNVPGYVGETPLAYAQKREYTEVANILRQHGATENLHAAVAADDIEGAKRLLSKGHDVNSRDSKDRTPLHLAAGWGPNDMVKFLFTRNADVRAQDNEGYTPLARAARRQRKEIVELLIKKGSDINVSNNQGLTPLATAKRQGHTGIVELLRKHGAEESQKNESSFEMAISANDLEKVKELISGGADVNVLDSKGNTPLYQAIRTRRLSRIERLSMVKMLISAGADVNAKNRRGNTLLDLAKRGGHTEIVEMLTKAAEEQKTDEKKPSEDESPTDSKELRPNKSLHQAAKDGDIEQVKRLIAQGADINAKDRRGNTPLFSAMGNRDDEMLKLLVDRGAEVNVSGNHGTTLLDNAIWRGDVKIVEYLLDEGADINLRGYRGFTAFRNAANAGHREVVDLLVSRGVDISNIHGAACTGDVAQVRSYLSQGVDVDQKDELGWTPLVWAVSMSQEDVVEVLLGHDAEVKMKTEDGTVPLCKAATKSKRIIELLISHGADVNVMDGLGSTPLYWAAMYNNLDGVKLFLKNGAEIDVRSKTSGFTPLHRASQWGHPEIVQILISGGADVNIKTKTGGTPLHMVLGQRNIRQLKGHDEVAELLLKSGADLNAKDNRGRTPLDSARQFGQTELVEMLTKAAEKQKDD